jgi:hypothetical protein
MMKNLVRTLIILIAAGLIALGWYAFSTTAASQAVEPARPAEFTPMDEPTGDQMPTSETSEGLPARPEEGGEMGFSLTRILTGMAANMGITAVVIVLIVWLRKLVNRLASSRFKFG